MHTVLVLVLVPDVHPRAMRSVSQRVVRKAEIKLHLLLCISLLGGFARLKRGGGTCRNVEVDYMSSRDIVQLRQHSATFSNDK